MQGSRKLKGWMIALLLCVLPAASAYAADAQSNTVTITGGYEKTVQTKQWAQTGSTQEAYTYQGRVTTYQNETVQTGTTTRRVQTGSALVQTGTVTETVQTGTKQVQTGTQLVCYGGWVNTQAPRALWRCVGPIKQQAVYQTEPVHGTETKPVYETEPVYRVLTVPVYAVQSVAVTTTQTLTGYRTVPTYGWVTVNTKQWVPIAIQEGSA